MLTGVYAARNIAGAQYDVWSVNVEQEYHEEGPAKDVSLAERGVPTAVRPEAPEAEMSPEKLVEAAFARLDPVALGTSIGAVAGLLMFVSTALLLIKGGVMVGKTLSLLSYYFWGYSVTWRGALWGFLQAGIGGFTLGYVVATLRNWGLGAYAFLLKRRAEAEASRDLLDKL